MRTKREELESRRVSVMSMILAAVVLTCPAQVFKIKETVAEDSKHN